MRSLNHNYTFKTTTPLEKNVTLSKLRKKNKILIIILTSFIISLTLIIGALIAYLVQENRSLSDQLVPLNNPLTLYSAPCNVPPCLRIVNTIITTKFIFDPYRILTLTLQRSIEDIENIVSLITLLTSDSSSGNVGNNDTTLSALTKCSNYLCDGSGRIQTILRVNPFMDGQNGEMIKSMTAVEANLTSCVDDLVGSEWRGVIEVREKVRRVKEYLSSVRENHFSYENDDVWSKFWGDVADKWGSTFGSVFMICVGVLQLVFMFFLFWTLFKFCCR